MSSTETEAAVHYSVFDVLTDESRCSAIEYLAMEGGTVTVDELAGFVTATTGSDEGAPQSQERTAVRFHHTHLPKMDAAGLLNYDREEQLAEPTEKLDLAFQLIDQAADTTNQ